MLRIAALALLVTVAASAEPPHQGRGAGTVPLWNPYKTAPGNPPLTVRVLVLNYDPLVPGEQHRRLSDVFRWGNPARMAMQYMEAMEHAAGGYLRFEIVEWRNLNEIYYQNDGKSYTVEEYVRNRRTGKGWRKGGGGMADYPRIIREQNVEPLIDDGKVDEVWIFSDHYFGLWEASMAGPGAFFINGGVYPKVPTRRPFAFYGFNYERGVAEMMHNAAHRVEATMNRAYGPWNLKEPKNNWEKFSANHDQSNGVAGVGTCHWPPNAKGDYDYGNKREVSSWADSYLTYPKLDFKRKTVSVSTWSKGPDAHLDYMKWYFGHLPRAAGVNDDGRQNNWFKYIFDFQAYDSKGKPLPPSAEILSGDVADPKAASHTLRIAYRSAEQIDPSSLKSENLAVTGPDGKALTVKLIDDNGPGGRSWRVARYSVAGPFRSGEYAVALKVDQVKTRDSKALPAGKLGGFRIASGGTALKLEAPAEMLVGGRAGARASGAVLSSSDPTVLSVDASGNLRAGKPGTAKLTARLGKLEATATVKVTDPGLPTAKLAAPVEAAKVGGGAVVFRVHFSSKAGLRKDAVQLGSVRVTGPGGFSAFPEVKMIDEAVAEYRLAPPEGKWADAGTYTIEVKAFHVTDTKGHSAPESVIGRFEVRK